MLKVAITGNIASGKSEVEKILREKSFPVLDSDVVAHDLCCDEKVKKIILEVFADFDILEDGEISRIKLGKIIFTDEILRKKLEKILHPLIKDEIKKFLNEKANEGEKIAFVSIPLLFEAQFESLFDKIILVYADDEIRLKRLMQRSDLTQEQAQNRINIQMNQNDKKVLSDFIIYNNDSLNFLHGIIHKTLELLEQGA